MKLFRATDKTEEVIHESTCWTPNEETAAEYRDNPGFGGDTLISVETDGSVLDIRKGDRNNLAGLAEALGYEDANETAQDWRDSGYLYPWEESRKVWDRLTEAGYDWICYVDDYPAGATTWKALRTMPATVEVLA